MKNNLYLILFIFIPSLFGVNWIHAQEFNQEVIQSLLKRVEVDTIDGREMALVPLSFILDIAIQRSLSIEASKMGEEYALSALIGTKERNHPSIKTSFGFTKSPSTFSS